MNDGSKILRYFLYVSLVGIGIVVGMSFDNFSYISTIEAINVIDIATLVTTIFLAVYIPEVLDRRLQIKRDKKGLIEERIEELQTLYRKINLIVQASENPLKPREIVTIKNTLDICEHKLETILTLVTASRLDVSFQEEVQEIKKLCNEHRDLLWPLKKDGNEFYYTEDTKEKEELLYNHIDQATCLIIFKISEA